MSHIEAMFLLLGIWALIAIPLVGLSMYLCKKRTGKWWR